MPNIYIVLLLLKIFLLLQISQIAPTKKVVIPFFISFSFFCLDTKERNKEKIKPADKELQNYGSLR